MAVAQAAVPIAVREYERGDERAVLELLALAFGKWPRGLDHGDPLEFFRWKTERCPFGASRSWVAEGEGGLVGFLAQLPWRMRIGDRTLTTLRGTDLAVHPNLRRRGVSQQLVRAAMSSQRPDVALAWNNPNAMSRGSVLKAGRRKALSVQRYARPSGSPALMRLLARGARTPRTLEPDAPPAAEVLSEGAFVDSLLARCPHEKTRLTTARSAEHLRWRYAFDDYRAVCVRAGEGAASGGGGDDGIAVFRVRRSGSVWLADVCELLAPSAHTARKLLRLVGAAAATDLTCCTFASPAQALRHGVPVRAGHLELTVRQVGGDLPVDLTSARAWALSLGDLELL